MKGIITNEHLHMMMMVIMIETMTINFMYDFLV